MPVAWRIEKPCPACGGDSDVWKFEKDEPTIVKEHYTCDACGHEWTQRREKD